MAIWIATEPLSTSYSYKKRQDSNLLCGPSIDFLFVELKGQFFDKLCYNLSSFNINMNPIMMPVLAKSIASIIDSIFPIIFPIKNRCVITTSRSSASFHGNGLRCIKLSNSEKVHRPFSACSLRTAYSPGADSSS